MRFLHTADWHVGKSIRGRSRLDEFAAVLDQIVAIARDESVDAVLLAGDVYEQRAPAPEADSIVFDTLVRLHDARIPVVIVPGNHDSAVRFDALGSLLRAIDVTVVPVVRRPDDGGIVVIPSRDGFSTAEIACVPFVPERRFGDAAALFDSPADWYQSYADGVGHLLEAYARAMRTDRVRVVVAHLLASGVRLGGGERQATVGLNYAVPPSRLPGTVNYVALGHIHRAQDVPGAPARARYPGSILQLDFGEVDQQKSVTIVEASPGTPARVRTIDITAGKRLIDVRGTLDEIAARAPEFADAYVRAFVLTDGPVPGIADRVREMLPTAVDVRPIYERASISGPGTSLAHLAPREQFHAYYRDAHGSEPHTAVMDAFDEVLAEKTGEVL